MTGKEGNSANFDFDHYHLTEEDVDKMISDAVFYLIVADQKKSVIKRPDLMRTCDLNKKHRQVQDYVLNRAAHGLLDTFGIRVSNNFITYGGITGVDSKLWQPWKSCLDS